MSESRVPDWRGPFATGLFGTAYNIGDGRYLVLLGAPGAVVGTRPDQTWPVVIMAGQVMAWTRDQAFEERLRSNEDFTAMTGTIDVAQDRLFTFQENELDKCLRILRAAALTPV